MVHEQFRRADGRVPRRKLVNELSQPNGNGEHQVVIVLDVTGNLTVTAPANKIIAFGMLTAAQHVLIGMKPAGPILPVKRIIP